MKILVTGSYGQLGRSLFNRLDSHSEIFWTGRNIPFDGNGFYLDICDRINLKELINFKLLIKKIKFFLILSKFF